MPPPLPPSQLYTETDGQQQESFGDDCSQVTPDYQRRCCELDVAGDSNDAFCKVQFPTVSEASAPLQTSRSLHALTALCVRLPAFLPPPNQWCSCTLSCRCPPSPPVPSPPW